VKVDLVAGGMVIDKKQGGGTAKNQIIALLVPVQKQENPGLKLASRHLVLKLVSSFLFNF